MNSILNWIQIHYIELSGTIISLIYIYFSIKQNILLWLTGLISAIIYTYVYFTAKFYADMSLQLYYVAISIYGWIYWKNQEKNETKSFPVQKINNKILLTILFLTSIGTFIFGYLLNNYTDSPIPYWDAFTTSASFVATWMLTKKYIENWLLWIIVDFISMILYYQKGLYSTVFLFAVFTILAFSGYYIWKKNMLIVHSENIIESDKNIH